MLENLNATLEVKSERDGEAARRMSSKLTHRKFYESRRTMNNLLGSNPDTNQVSFIEKKSILILR